MNKQIYYNSPSKAMEDLKIKKNQTPGMIHTLKYENKKIFIESVSLDHYLDNVYYKSTGKVRPRFNKTMLNIIDSIRKSI